DGAARRVIPRPPPDTPGDSMRRIPPSRLAALLATLCAVTACAGGSEAPNSASSTTRDSAGVAIVESTEPAQPRSAGWMVGETPTLSIGDADGTEPALLFSRVIYVSRLD